MTVALSLDHTDPAGFGLRQSRNGIVQLTLGQEARVTLTTESGFVDVLGSALPRFVVEGVMSFRSGDSAEPPRHARVEAQSAADIDATVLSGGGSSKNHSAAVESNRAVWG